MTVSDKLQSRTIDFLRFPLCVGVVLIHSELFQLSIGGGKVIPQEELFPIYLHLSYLLTRIADIAVKLFFFISGFLFFYKIEDFNRKTYIGKIKKRARTVLVPYIFWNLLMLIMVAIFQQAFPNMMSGRKKLVADYSLLDWLSAFWAIGNEGEGAFAPIDYPLWFIRELMVVMIFSPIIYLFVKKLRKFGIVALALLWVSSLWKDVPGGSLTAILFFTAGGWFSINKKNFVEYLKPCLPWVTLAYCIVLLILTYFMGELGEWRVPIERIGMLLGIASVITLSAYFLEKGIWRENTFLAKSSFFIFACHAFYVSMVQRCVMKLVQPNDDFTLIIVYLLVPVITVGIALYAYYFFKRFMPSFSAFITGGR